MSQCASEPARGVSQMCRDPVDKIRRPPHTCNSSPLPMLRRTAPPSRPPSGRYAVGLRTSLDPDGLTSACPAPTEKAKEEDTYPLTGPAPSGLNCGITWQDRKPPPLRGHSPRLAA